MILIWTNAQKKCNTGEAFLVSFKQQRKFWAKNQNCTVKSISTNFRFLFYFILFNNLIRPKTANLAILSSNQNTNSQISVSKNQKIK